MGQEARNEKIASGAGKGALAVLLVASMMNLMGGAAVSPALPQMSAAFPEASATVVSLVITLPALAIALVGLFVGAVADKVGKVRTLAVASAVFTVAGMSGAFLDSLSAILVGRFVLGIGIAGITVATTAIISERYAGKQRQRVLALQSAAMGVGILVLEYGGGLLAELGWHTPFLIYALGAVILVGVMLFLREPVPEDMCAQDGAADGGAVVVSEPPRRLVVMTVVGGAVTIFVLQVLSFTFPSKLPYFMEELGAAPSMTGLFLGLHGSCMAVASLLQGRFASRVSRPTLLFAGFLAMGVCFALFFTVPLLPVVLLAACLGGVGIGLVMPTVLQWITTVMTPETSGKIMGCYTVCLNLGQFASSLILAPVLALTGSNQGLFGFFAGVAAACCIAVAIAHGPISRDTLRVVEPETVKASR